MILQARVMHDHAKAERNLERSDNGQSVLDGLRMLFSPARADPLPVFHDDGDDFDWS